MHVVIVMIFELRPTKLMSWAYIVIYKHVVFVTESVDSM